MSYPNLHSKPSVLRYRTPAMRYYLFSKAPFQRRARRITEVCVGLTEICISVVGL
jgi:hypothetical protein